MTRHLSRSACVHGEAKRMNNPTKDELASATYFNCAEADYYKFANISFQIQVPSSVESTHRECRQRDHHINNNRTAMPERRRPKFSSIARTTQPLFPLSHSEQGSKLQRVRPTGLRRACLLPCETSNYADVVEDCRSRVHFV
ncbi:hypothetical protein ABKN59_004232 [Abortiporus biennis]